MLGFIRFKVFIIIIVFLFAVGFFAFSAAAGQWIQETPSTAPSPRADHAMASVGADQVVLFGGLLSESFASVNETWVYDPVNNSWTNMLPPSTPPATRYHAMASLGGDKALLFGGQTQGDEFTNDTWVYDLSENNWTHMEPDTAPSIRRFHAMAYIGGDQVLLFGGTLANYSADGETWIYDLSDDNWTLQTPSSAPAARRSHAMAYLGGDKVVLFGGSLADFTADGQTWIYDLSDGNWTLQTPSSTPSARRSPAMASLGDDQVLLFGGFLPSFSNSDETWIYDLSDSNWTVQTLSSAPSPRSSHAMASIGAGRALLFGGSIQPGNNGETWIYTTVDAVQAFMDIGFCGNPNSFNCKQKGVLPVTIFGSSGIDVSAIEISTLRLCLANDPDSCVSPVDAEFPEDRGNPLTDLGTSQCVGNLANPDGLDDLGVLFVAREVAELIDCSKLGKKATSPTLIIKGELSNGTQFISTPADDKGIDQLRISNK